MELVDMAYVLLIWFALSCVAAIAWAAYSMLFRSKR